MVGGNGLHRRCFLPRLPFYSTVMIFFQMQIGGTLHSDRSDVAGRHFRTISATAVPCAAVPFSIEMDSIARKPVRMLFHEPVKIVNWDAPFFHDLSGDLVPCL